MEAKPDLRPDLTLAWEAFWSLGGDRHLGISHPGPLPFTAIDAYGRRLGLVDPDEFDRFRHIVMAADAAYRAWIVEKYPIKGDE